MSEQSESKPEALGGPKELTGHIGKYEITRPLGKGAMGMVYLAHDTMLERDVALKVMVAAIADDPELKKRFEREAKAVAKMTHPNVVMVFDLGYHTDGSPYLAMELLKGSDLQKAMREPPPMSLDRKVAIITQVLAGLAHAHQAGIVHRDIKPANIFICQDGAVKIMDFGVARLTTASMTGTGNIVGTADYMSPEQVKGAKVDGRSDVFSVGCMLYELLTGRRPFHSDNLMAIFYKITHEEPNFDLVPAGPEYDALMPVLKKALAKELDDRYQSAYDFAVDLREFLKHHASTSTGEHALESLVDLEAPPTTPPDYESGSGETEISVATMDIRPATGAPTRGRAAGTGAGPGPTVVGGPGTTGRTRVGPAPSAPTRFVPRPVPQPSRAPLYAGIGVVVLAAAAGGGYFLLNPPAPAPPVTEAALPQTTLAPPTTAATPEPPPPTTAPPPTFAETQGRGARAMRAAQSALSRGRYDEAISQAQQVLAEEPGNADAKKLVSSALDGQKAEARFAASRSAVAAGDFAKAVAEAEAGSQLAPWDRRGPDLITQAREAQQKAEREAQEQAQAQRAAQVNQILGKADDAIAGQKFDEAIALYDQVLQMDPQNQRAGIGRTNAISARAVATAARNATAAAPQAPSHGFVLGKTRSTSVQARAQAAGPAGFGEAPPGVAVKQGTALAELPGKIFFSVDPESPKAGDKYSIRIEFANEGAAPISIKSMVLTTTVNGKTARNPVPPAVKDVAPRDRATLLSLNDYWREDTGSWSMEVAVNTTLGETYINKVSWK